MSVVWRLLRWTSPFGLVRRIVLGLAFTYLAGTFVEVWWASTRDERGNAEAIVVLGAAQYDGRPSRVLAARLDHAVELYQAGVAPMVVVTGGRRDGDRLTEAAAGARYLAGKGVPDKDIRREVQGRDTWEELAATARFLRKEGVTRVVLVSDAYHSARLSAVAKEVGLTPRVSPAGRSAPVDRLAKEAMAMAVGRVIGFRRLSGITRDA